MAKPFFHTFLVYKIRQVNHSEILEIAKIKETVSRITRSNGGLPKNMIRYVIQDLIDLGLIIKFSNDKYKIVQTPLENKIKALMMCL